MSTSTDLHSRSIFELTEADLHERLRPAYEEMKAGKFAGGGYVTYHDPEICLTELHVIHGYSDRKQLMLLDEHGQASFVQYL